MKNASVNQRIVVLFLAIMLLVFGVQDMNYGQTLPPHLSIYWAHWSQIQYWDGSNIRDLITDRAFPEAVALDVTGGKMYWASWISGEPCVIRRSNLDGSNVTDFITELGEVRSIALDVPRGQIYWSTQTTWDPVNRTRGTGGKIQRANLDGSNITDLVTVGFGYMLGLNLDRAGGKMYWTNHRNTIQRANLNGSNVQNILNMGNIDFLQDIALDVSGNKIYFSTLNVRTDIGDIESANLDGSNVVNLIAGLRKPSSIAIDTADSKMYWTSLNPLGTSTGAGDGKIRCANLDGSNVQDILTGLDAPSSIALGVPLQTPGVPPGTNDVHIPDPNLRAAIAEALNKAPADAITRADMETLRELYAGFRDITDLRGIEFAINLDYLGLWNNSISDISPLSNLTNLTELYLLDNSISDISPLSRLTNLEYLRLDSNSISDISPLSSLTNLTGLDLSANDISDISPLSRLTNLTELDLAFNDISDISPLSRLTNLTRLNLWSNSISDSDISPLSRLTNLTELYLGRNSISDISLLSRLTNLTRLELWSNSISNISPLSRLANLTWLNLGRNSISNISPLSRLTNLIWLDIRNNNISDVETLDRLTARGTVVYFRDNPAFETPGPKIEDGWLWLIVPATEVENGSHAAASGRDFLSEASGGAVTEADVARNGARAGTRVGNSVWTAAPLDATDPNNLNTIAQNLAPDLAYSVDPGVVPIHAETPPEIGDSAWTTARLDPTDIDKRNVLMPDDNDDNLEADFPYPVAYGVVPIHAERPQQTRLYIGAGPVKIWFNGTLVYRDTNHRFEDDYQTAVPVTLTPGENLLFIAAYRSHPRNPWGAFFGFQDGTRYTVGAPSAGNLDVNGNGQVNVIDLVLVAAAYGARGDGIPADVNADGIVNVQDLIAVAAGIDASGVALPQALKEALLAGVGDLEAIAEAPRVFSTAEQVFSAGIVYSNVAAALADVRHLATNDARLGKWVPLLEELLQVLAEMEAIPQTTALLPNYPNPFNPETWIPYHLATDAEVTLTIYDVRGSVVRELSLGHQPAGVYESRGRAAYWDGKNASGESVASGVYFYTLTAGDFTATRKLLIAK